MQQPAEDVAAQEIGTQRILPAERAEKRVADQSIGVVGRDQRTDEGHQGPEQNDQQPYKSADGQTEAALAGHDGPIPCVWFRWISAQFHLRSLGLDRIAQRSARSTSTRKPRLNNITHACTSGKSRVITPLTNSVATPG
ncbi:hypothetical protein D9M68_387160 [compost metagenome]